MSKHSRNATSQSIFTYGERQKLKGQYGTKQERISQDSLKRFEICNICSSKMIEPMCCDQGHTFCRSCIIEFLVKQKKKIQEQNQLAQQNEKKKIEKEELKKIQEKAKKIAQFQKYDNFQSIADRNKLLLLDQQPEQSIISKEQAKPTGIYEQTNDKDKYVKSSFWTIENTPVCEAKTDKVKNVVNCPASNHKITMKKMRHIIAKQIQGQFICGVCSKEIGRQKIGTYKCGHLICVACKSEKCEICDKKQGWIEVESSSSAFASHNKSQVKTYTHAFYL